MNREQLAAALAAPRAHSGRFVDLAEMVPFAKPGHNACREHPGYIVMVVGKDRQLRPCRCAALRFKKVHGAHVYDNPTTGTLFWHPEHMPARTVATQAPPAERPPAA